MTFPFGLRPATRPKGLENQDKTSRCENGYFRLDLLGDFGNCWVYQTQQIPGLAGYASPASCGVLVFWALVSPDGCDTARQTNRRTTGQHASSRESRQDFDAGAVNRSASDSCGALRNAPRLT